MSTPTIHRISESEYYDPTRIKVPAWLWSLAVGWRHRKQPFDRLSVVAATHWHPDQPEAPTTTPTPAESAPQSAPAQGETPRIYEACLNWDNTGDYRKRLVSVEYYEQLKRELNEAKQSIALRNESILTLANAEATLRAQVAQLTGAQDRMDAEIAMLTADLFRATSERDQARQDLEERCAENDRERAAHLQAYQEACKERDEARAELPKEAFASNVAILELQSKLTAAERELAEAKAERDEVRQWLAERPSTELYQRAVTRNEVLCAKLTAATEEAERLRERTEKLRNQRDLAEAEADTLRQQLATSQDWGEKARKAIGLALDQIDDQRNASESAGRCIDRLTALLSSYPAQGMEGRG